jgi:hypothetical protein
MNALLQRLTQRGTLSQKQEKALVSFAVNLGRKKFSEYRQAVGVDTPIPRLSKFEASSLLNTIIIDLEAGHER